MNLAQIIVCKNGCMTYFTLVDKNGVEDVLTPCRIVAYHDKGVKMNTYVFLHPLVIKIILSNDTGVIHRRDLSSIVVHATSVQHYHGDGTKRTRLIM